MRSANRPMLPCVWSEGRQLPLRSACGLRRRISGPVWSSSSGELKGSQFYQRRTFCWSRSIEGLEGRLPARRAAGSGFVPAGFQSPRSSVSGDSGTASSPRSDDNTASSNVTKQIKDVCQENRASRPPVVGHGLTFEYDCSN